ncbi:hypothetical protein RUND412_005090 [Rhizina undulata]
MPFRAFFAIRILQILTLIPIWGILAYFVNVWNLAGYQPPSSVLTLFITALLATVWVGITLIHFHQRRYTPLYYCLIDIAFFGVLIAGVIVLAPLAQNTNCITAYSTAYGYAVIANKFCMMYKAAWGLGILNILLFFFSAMAALMIVRQDGTEVRVHVGRHV